MMEAASTSTSSTQQALKRFVCHCKKAFTHRYLLARHQKSVHEGSTRVKCHCGQEFSATSSLIRHQRKAHEGSSRIACHCGKKFSTNAALARHKRSAHEGVVFRCTFADCRRTFSDFYNRRRHEKTAHGVSKPQRISCHCGKSFANEQGLARHQKSAHEGVVFKCSVAGCTKTFTDDSVRIRHERTMHGESARFPCPVCGHEFKQMCNLDTHLRRMPAVHTRQSRQSIHLLDTQLTTVGTFLRHCEVRDQHAVHNTSLEAKLSIQKSMELRVQTSFSSYDGAIADSEKSIDEDGDDSPLLPGCAYMSVFPSCDGAIVPVSSFPRDAPGGAKTAMLMMDLKVLGDLVESSKVSLFHVATTPTQFGKRELLVYQCHVAVVPADVVERFRLRSEFTELDPCANTVFRYDAGSGLWHIATKFRESSEDEPRRLQLVLAFVGGLKLDKHSERVRWVESTKLCAVGNPSKKHSQFESRFSCPNCNAVCRGVKRLKEHILVSHLGGRYLCAYDGCACSYAQISIRDQHEKLKHEGIKLPCRESGCRQLFSDVRHRLKHERQVHNRSSGARGRKNEELHVVDK